MSVTLVIPRALSDRIFGAARAAAPSEVVGILGGKASRATELIELTNQLGEAAFFVHPREQFAAERRISTLGLEIVAIYHSHPGGGPTMSVRDIFYAARWQVVHLVVAVARRSGLPDEMFGYVVNEGVQPVRVVIE